MIIRVKVTPRAKRPRIEKAGDGLKVYLSTPAIEGRANKKLIEVLADYLNIKKYKIKIIKGAKQREKILEIQE